MRNWRLFSLIAACSLILMAPTMAATGKRDLGTEILGENDGWASFDTGTTGGSAADPEQVYIVHNRSELIAALNNGVYPPPKNPSDEPKIIYIDGTIDANVDDNNQPLTCQDYYRDGYTPEAFMATYDPAVWVPDPESDEEIYGPLEDARLASRNAQQERVRIRVGSNTTIVGLGSKATIRGAWLDIRKFAIDNPGNIIIRNITFKDTYDCFPEWSPSDGEKGSWNALYDSISIRNAHHVWVDHNRFEDDDTIDKKLPLVFGVIYQVHDGLLDITNGSNYVTVSWNVFRNHDKTMLIGSSDSGSTAAGDKGKLKVTLHHNMFDGMGQRVPRVRFGQVHVYNNLYKIANTPNYVYSWGVGIDSSIYAENNVFMTDQSVPPANFIGVYKGTKIFDTGTMVNGNKGLRPVNVVAEYNATHDPDLSTDVGWTPELYTTIDPTWKVIPAIQRGVGPFGW